MVKFKKQSAVKMTENLITVNTGDADYPIRNIQDAGEVLL